MSTPTPPRINSDNSAHLTGVPDVRATIDARGWLALDFRLDGWEVQQTTWYVPNGEDAVELASRIITALGDPRRTPEG